MLSSTSPPSPSSNSTPMAPQSAPKRKRRPAGTPDPDAEVVSLSPKTLLESDRYVCEICKQGFRREQNLQMHRRRHNVPWKPVKRDAGAAAAVRKRVFVCPEASCVYHDPAHALGDLVGIKKHYRRKHSAVREWGCARCGKGYAVRSDYKAHLKTCGTRGHSCDCGRVFSRVDSFIEHQDTCNAGRAQAGLPCLSPTASSLSSLSDTNLSTATACPSRRMPMPAVTFSPTVPSDQCQLRSDDAQATKLQLSIGPTAEKKPAASTCEEMRLAMAEKATAEEEFANGKRIRRQAREEPD